MLVPVAIGQQLSMLKQNKFIKVYLDLVLTSTYVCSQLKDYDSGNVIQRERLDYEKETQRVRTDSKEFKEGVSAFVEKRKPNFRNNSSK